MYLRQIFSNIATFVPYFASYFRINASGVDKEAISRNGAASIRTSMHNGTAAIVRIGDKVVKVMGR